MDDIQLAFMAASNVVDSKGKNPVETAVKIGQVASNIHLQMTKYREHVNRVKTRERDPFLGDPDEPCGRGPCCLGAEHYGDCKQ